MSHGAEVILEQEDDSMSLITDEIEEEEEEEQEAVERSQAPLPSILLSFSNASGGAWDDRELINAYDTAMSDFHAHHPGPGSWLDKTTAALALGKPLPGTEVSSEAWFAASDPAKPKAAADVPQSAPVAGASRSQATTTNSGVKRVRLEENGKPSTSTAKKSRSNGNPYASSTAFSHAAESSSTPPSRIAGAGRASPVYNPPSPDIAQSQDLALAMSGTSEAHASGVRVNASPTIVPSNPGPSSHIPPLAAIAPAPGATSGPSSYGVQATDNVSSQDALSYAMTAQYWAGYWMGVAQSKTAQVSVPATAAAAPVQSAAQAERSETSTLPSNAFITRKQFGHPNANGFKR